MPASVKLGGMAEFGAVWACRCADGRTGTHCRNRGGTAATSLPPNSGDARAVRHGAGGPWTRVGSTPLPPRCLWRGITGEPAQQPTVHGAHGLPYVASNRCRFRDAKLAARGAWPCAHTHADQGLLSSGLRSPRQPEGGAASRGKGGGGRGGTLSRRGVPACRQESLKAHTHAIKPEGRATDCES